MTTKRDSQNKDLEPIIIMLLALLRLQSQGNKIDTATKQKIVQSLNRARYSQLNIASIVGISATDVNKYLKKAR